MTNSKLTSRRHSRKHTPVDRSRATRTLLAVITGYQKLRAGRTAPCRFYPSCSHYAYEAIEVHGATRGAALALRRLSKCRPFGPHGIDLVPEAKKDRTPTS